MARAAGKQIGTETLEAVDQAIVQQPQSKKSAPDMQPTTWSFDHEAAESLYADALKKALVFAKLEHEVPLAMRALGAAIHAFVINIMPDVEIDRLRSAGRGVVHGKDSLSENVVAFLREKRLPLPSFNSTNPVQGIVAHFYQYARLFQHVKSLDTQHEIHMASQPATMDELVAGDDEARRLTAAEQTQQSKLARWVLAAVEMPADEEVQTGGGWLFNKGFPAAIGDWTAWREKNPDKVISAARPQPIRRTKKEREAEKRRREEQAQDRRMQEQIEASNVSEASRDEVVGGDLLDTPLADALAPEPIEPHTFPADRSAAEPDEATPELIKARGLTEPAEPTVVELPEPIQGGWHTMVSGEDTLLTAEQVPWLTQVIDYLPARASFSFEKTEHGLRITGWH
jgi:hypothetical protein